MYFFKKIIIHNYCIYSRNPQDDCIMLESGIKECEQHLMVIREGMKNGKDYLKT